MSTGDFVIDGAICGPIVDNTKLLLGLWLIANGRKIKYTKEVKNVVLDKKEVEAFIRDYKVTDTKKLFDFLLGTDQ